MPSAAGPACVLIRRGYKRPADRSARGGTGMALARGPANKAIAAALVAAGLAGCGSLTGSRQARDENQKMDCLTRCGEELERKSAKPVLVARSQMPEVLPAVRLGNPTPGAGKPAPVDTDAAAEVRSPINSTPTNIPAPTPRPMPP